ncbi:MAG: hypothetical protein ACLR6I_20055 [Waltera sp.]
MKYLFIYSHSADIGFTTCALVPMRVVTSQATEIQQHDHRSGDPGMCDRSDRKVSLSLQVLRIT